jgi:preprotein translocase subunit SecE
MSKQKAVATSSLVGEIFHVGLYKPSQGRVTRQVTCGSVWVIAGIGVWRLQQALYQFEYWQYAIPLIVLMIGGWAGFRLVNYPKFADFLIAVEAEMNKVSWPSRAELTRSSFVVIFVIFALAMILFGYDLLWRFLFKNVIGILK